MLPAPSAPCQAMSMSQVASTSISTATEAAQQASQKKVLIGVSNAIALGSKVSSREKSRHERVGTEIKTSLGVIDQAGTGDRPRIDHRIERSVVGLEAD